MNNILSQIFHGEYSALENGYHASSAYSIAFKKMEKLEDELQNSLPEAQRAKFMEFRESFQKVSDLSGEQDFIAGYRIGVRMMLAALPNEL